MGSGGREGARGERVEPIAVAVVHSQQTKCGNSGDDTAAQLRRVAATAHQQPDHRRYRLPFPPNCQYLELWVHHLGGSLAESDHQQRRLLCRNPQRRVSRAHHRCVRVVEAGPEEKPASPKKSGGGNRSKDPMSIGCVRASWRQSRATRSMDQGTTVAVSTPSAYQNI